MNVDVIIPCFNVEDFIEECLDSVKLQGKCVRKVFCVDNNSTDNTVKTIQKWSTQNPDIDLLVLHEKKPGASSARRILPPSMKLLPDKIRLPGAARK